MDPVIQFIGQCSGMIIAYYGFYVFCKELFSKNNRYSRDDFFKIGEIRPIEEKSTKKIPEHKKKPTGLPPKPSAEFPATLNVGSRQSEYEINNNIKHINKLVDNIRKNQKGFVTVENLKIEEQIRKTDKSPVKKNQKAEFNYEKFKDHVDALIAVGYKKNVAKNIVRDYFSKNPEISASQFVVEFFKKSL